MQDLYEKCLGWFLGNFRNGQHGSLQILLEDSEGHLRAIKVNAKNDEQMFEMASKLIGKHSPDRFIALGEGNVMGDEKPIPVLIMYFQTHADVHVQSAVMPYRHHPSGELEMTSWQEMEPLDQSWL
jgi:hypothetical protein